MSNRDSGTAVLVCDMVMELCNSDSEIMSVLYIATNLCGLYVEF